MFEIPGLFGVANWTLPGRERFEVTWLCRTSAGTGDGARSSQAGSSTSPRPLPVSHTCWFTGHAFSEDDSRMEEYGEKHTKNV